MLKLSISMNTIYFNKLDQYLQNKKQNLWNKFHNFYYKNFILCNFCNSAKYNNAYHINWIITAYLPTGKDCLRIYKIARQGRIF